MNKPEAKVDHVPYWCKEVLLQTTILLGHPWTIGVMKAEK